MSGKVWQFGSLADRVESAHRSPAATTVRHAWLDGHTPVLVAHWRRGDHGAWEDLVMGIGEFGPAMTWVTAARLQAAHEQSRPNASAQVGGEHDNPTPR